MSNSWEERFDSHYVWSAIDSLSVELERVELPLDKSLADSFARVAGLLERVRVHREIESGKDLYTSSMLQSMRSSVEQVASGVSQYLADPVSYASYLTNAADSCDSAYDILATWPIIPSRGQVVAAGKAASTYVDASQEALTELTDRVESARTELDALRTEARDEIESTRVTNSEAVDSFNQKLAVELASLREQVVTLENTISENYTSLTEFSSKASTDLQAVLDEADDRIDTHVSEGLKKAISELQDQSDTAVFRTKEVQKSINTIQAEVSKTAEETNKVAASFARRAVAEDYQKNAKNKAIAGWVWDSLGFFVGAIPLAFVLYHFMTVNDVGSVTSVTVSRLGVSLAAVGIAALCFHRGSVNHKESRVAKRTDLRVRTVNSFIANLSPDAQTAVLEGMADRIFLQGKLDPSDGPTEESESGLSMLSSYISDVVSRRQSEDRD